MNDVFILLDAMGIQRYVFETNNLRIILGSSLALARWQKKCEELCKFYDGRLYTSAGGNVLAKFAAENKAINFKNDAVNYSPAGLEIAWAKTTGASIHKEVWQNLQREIARYKAGDREISNYPPDPKPPPIPGCRHCGVREKAPIPKIDNKPICSACNDRYQEGVSLKSGVGQETPIEKIYEIPTELGLDPFPDDLNLLTKDRDINEPLAIVVADLNNMGSKIKDLIKNQGFDEFKNFSEKLESSFTSLFEMTLRSIETRSDGKGESKDKEYIRIRPLLLSGDDAAFAMPLSLWVFFVRQIFAGLRNDPFLISENISISVGVAIAKHTYPINRLAGMAEELVSNAKNKQRWYTRDNPDTNENCLDWQMHQESSFSSPLLVRKRSYMPVREENRLYEISTCKPYLETEFNALFDEAQTIQALFKDSNKKLFQLYRSLREGTQATRNMLVYALLRDESEKLEKYKFLWDHIIESEEEKTLWQHTTFKKDRYEPSLYSTKFADLIELGWYI